MVGMRGSRREGRASGPGATLLLALVASVLLAVGPSEARKNRKVPKKETAIKKNAHRTPLAGGGRASMVEEFMEFVPRLQASPARVIMPPQTNISCCEFAMCHQLIVENNSMAMGRRQVGEAVGMDEFHRVLDRGCGHSHCLTPEELTFCNGIELQHTATGSKLFVGLMWLAANTSRTNPDADAVGRLLAQAGADCNRLEKHVPVSEGATALHEAAAGNRLPLVEACLRGNGDVRARDRAGKWALLMPFKHAGTFGTQLAKDLLLRGSAAARGDSAGLTRLDWQRNMKTLPSLPEVWPNTHAASTLTLSAVVVLRDVELSCPLPVDAGSLTDLRPHARCGCERRRYLIRGRRRAMAGACRVVRAVRRHAAGYLHGPRTV